MPTVPKHSYKVEGSNGNTTKSVRNKLQTVETQPFLGVLFLPFFGSQHILFHRTFGVDKTITRTLASLSHCCVVETRSHKMNKKSTPLEREFQEGHQSYLFQQDFAAKYRFNIACPVSVTSSKSPNKHSKFAPYKVSGFSTSISAKNMVFLQGDETSFL